MKNADCIFCKIVDKKIASGIVFENEKILAFKDLNPKMRVHYLFIPKVHYDSLAHIPPQEMAVMSDLYAAIKQVSENEGFAQSGYKTQINTGRGGGQEVFHLHVHLMAT